MVSLALMESPWRGAMGWSRVVPWWRRALDRGVDDSPVGRTMSMDHARIRLRTRPLAIPPGHEEARHGRSRTGPFTRTSLLRARAGHRRHGVGAVRGAQESEGRAGPRREAAVPA